MTEGKVTANTHELKSISFLAHVNMLLLNFTYLKQTIKTIYGDETTLVFR